MVNCQFCHLERSPVVMHTIIVRKTKRSKAQLKTICIYCLEARGKGMRSKRDDYKRKLLPGHTVGRQNNSHGKTNEFILTPSRKKSLKGRGFSVDKCERCGLILEIGDVVKGVGSAPRRRYYHKLCFEKLYH